MVRWADARKSALQTGTWAAYNAFVTDMLARQVVARAEADPHHVAIDMPGRTRTYRALVGAARCTAAEIKRRGAVGPIGVHLPRGDDFVAAALAAWMLGEAIVPLSSSHPIARRRQMIRHAGVTWVIGSGDGLEVETLDVTWGDGDLNARVDMAPTDTAYLIFTSGSSGAPKAARILHGGLANTIDAQVELFGIKSSSRVLWALNPGFDASFSDIGTALYAGATLVIEPERAEGLGTDLLRRAIARRVTHADVPPSLLGLFDPSDLPSANFTIVVGGEVCPAAVVRRWAERCRLFVVYGPTETSICSSVARATADWSRAWIGRPLPKVDYRVMDHDGRSAADGVGELWIGGVGVAAGYVNDIAQTQQRFTKLDGERFFRTGDRVRVHDDGRYEFLGRIDRQLKLHGQLVAPEEIEATLTLYPGIARAVVQRAPDTTGAPKLVATIETSQSIDTADLRAFLREKIPTWMVPSVFTFVSALPTNTNLKLDTRVKTATEIDDPRLRSVAAVFTRVLGRPVDADEDFFAAGGDSLGFLHLVAALSEHGSVVTLDLVRRHPTPRAMLSALDAHPETTDAEPTARLIERVCLPTSFVEAFAAADDKDVGADVFVTGATGFLGGCVVRELLTDQRRTVHCLVRARDDTHAAHRLAVLAAVSSGQVVAVRGDLGRPRLGLDAERWGTLARTCGTVFHLAANTSVSATYPDLERTNVHGTQEVLRFAATARRKVVHYASTLSVFVGSDQNTGTFKETDDPGRATAVYGGYAQTKWVAELCCWRARAAGLKVAVHRLGLITGDTKTGRMNADDLLSRFLRGLGEHPMLPRAAAAFAFDVTPVDYAARAIVALAGAGGEGVFHIAGPRTVTLEDLVAALGGRVGFVDDQRLLPPTLDAHLAQALADPAQRIARRSVDLFQATDTRFDTTRTSALLEPLGIVCPPPDAALLRRYFASAQSEALGEDRGTQ